MEKEARSYERPPAPDSERCQQSSFGALSRAGIFAGPAPAVAPGPWRFQYLGLSRRHGFALSVLRAAVVRRHIILNLRHHDKASLLAGKLHAFLARRYVKGRDIYDLIWYLSDRTWPEPNLELLNNALAQTGWQGPQVTAGNWRQLVAQRVEMLDWKQVAADVEPFLERPADLGLLKRESLTSLLRPEG